MCGEEGGKKSNVQFARHTVYDISFPRGHSPLVHVRDFYFLGHFFHCKFSPTFLFLFVFHLYMKGGERDPLLSLGGIQPFPSSKKQGYIYMFGGGGKKAKHIRLFLIFFCVSIHTRCAPPSLSPFLLCLLHTQ